MKTPSTFLSSHMINITADTGGSGHPAIGLNYIA